MSGRALLGRAVQVRLAGAFDQHGVDAGASQRVDIPGEKEVPRRRSHGVCGLAAFPPKVDAALVARLDDEAVDLNLVRLSLCLGVLRRLRASVTRCIRSIDSSPQKPGGNGRHQYAGRPPAPRQQAGRMSG